MLPVLARKSVFTCMSLNNNFNIRGLERYLSAVWNS